MPSLQDLPSRSPVASNDATTAQRKTQHLLALPAFTDNYIWMLHDGIQALVVDPGEAAPVVSTLERLGLTLAGILVTHHHGDHVGGVDGLRPLLPDGGRHTVHAPAHEVTPKPNVQHVEGDRVTLLGINFDVLDVPGHTSGTSLTLPPNPARWTTTAWLGTRHAALPLCCSAATRCSRVAVAVCSKARPHRCTRRCKSSRLCQVTRAFAARMNTRCPTCASRRPWSPTAQTWWNTPLGVTHNATPCTRPCHPPSRKNGCESLLRPHVPDVVRSGLAKQATSDQPVDIFAALRAWKNTF